MGEELGNMLWLLKDFYEFDNNFEYKFHNLKYISKANNYFYIVEIAHDFGITDVINDILKMNKLITLINNDKCKVILGYESEGDIDMSEFNKLGFKVIQDTGSHVAIIRLNL